MKILVYAHQFPPAKGGIPYSNYEIAKGLYNLGHEVHVVACKNEGSAMFLKKVEFPVYLLPKWPFAPMHCLSGLGLLNWLFLPFYLITIVNKIQLVKPDIIFVLDETSNCFWGIWSKAIKRPYVSYCSVPFSRFNKTIKRRQIFVKKYFTLKKLFIKLFTNSYSKAKLIICVSNSTKNEINKMLPVMSSRLVVVGRSVNDSFFETPPNKNYCININGTVYNIRNKELILLSVSRLTRDKGIDDVIKTLATFNSHYSNKILYLVVGEGDARNYLKKLVQYYKIENMVLFAGGISHSRLIPIYDICDLFILPSRRGISESFGRVFVEAAARNKPSIGVKDGGMVDIIEDGVNGFLVRSGDIIEIKNKISYLMDNRNEIKRMGSNARQKAEKMFTSLMISSKIELNLKKAINISRL